MFRVDLDSDCCDLASSNTSETHFDYVNTDEVSYSDFFKRYILSNKPCVVRNVTNGWNCKQDWILDGQPNFTALLNDYGEAEVPVANCSQKYFNSHPKDCMKLQDYLAYWKDYIASSHSPEMPCLYLKDWHCFKEYPDRDIYVVPEYFASDWLNEYYLSFSELNDDYRFVYMGPKGTWTPLHKDVFSSFSWSVNICGRKEWKFYPPDQVALLSDKFGNLAFNVNDVDDKDLPELSQARCIILDQGPGDGVFVPSGWYHQVFNRAETISINHNWINGCNIQLMFSNLLSEFDNVRKELSDCQDSEDWSFDCQRLLKATFGMDFQQFYHFIKLIISRRLDALNNKCDLKLPSGHLIGPKLMQFDLKSAKCVLIMLLEIDNVIINKDNVRADLNDINKSLEFG